MEINAAGILVINKKGEVLMLHRIVSVSEGGLWGMPGGKVVGENTSLETAIIKTTWETGLEFNPESLIPLGQFRFEADGNQIEFTVWMARTMLSSKSRINLNSAGHDDYKWEKPEVLLKHKDLMAGMYPILESFLEKYCK